MEAPADQWRKRERNKSPAKKKIGIVYPKMCTLLHNIYATRLETDSEASPTESIVLIPAQRA